MASLGIMAAGIAHEINNRLNFIQGGIFGIESYTNTHLNEHLINIKPLIDAIKEGVSRASDIVKSLNHYSRNSNLEFAPVHIHPVIENCLVYFTS
jgi:signal transduction histidine kinase